MTIITGMMLVCWVKVYGINSYSFFVKDVQTKVLYVTDDKKAVVEHDFGSAPGIYFPGNHNKVMDTVDVVDLTSSTYMRCKAK